MDTDISIARRHQHSWSKIQVLTMNTDCHVSLTRHQMFPDCFQIPTLALTLSFPDLTWCLHGNVGRDSSLVSEKLQIL